MKKITYLILVVLITICSLVFGINSKSEMDIFVTLNSLESIAACEVSSNSAENTGYCTSINGGIGYACLNTGWGQGNCVGN